MHRFFLAPSAFKDDMVYIDGETARQLIKVLRITPGEIIEVFDGTGSVSTAKIETIGKTEVVAKLLISSVSGAEPKLHIALVQGLAKGDKLEFIIQKATELGVKEIFPVSSMRSVVQLDDKKAQERLHRWRKVAIEASEQSGRAYIPEIHTFRKLVDAASQLAFSGYELIVPWEQENAKGIVTHTRKLLIDSDQKSFAKLAIFIGPEGGFDPSEMDKLRSFNAVPVTLGKRILRTETAGITAITCALAISEDIP